MFDCCHELQILETNSEESLGRDGWDVAGIYIQFLNFL